MLETMRGFILKPEEGWLPFGEMHKKALLELGLTSPEEQLNFYRALSNASECQCVRLSRALLLANTSWFKLGLDLKN